MTRVTRAAPCDGQAVPSASLQQFGVRSLLDNTTVAQYQNLIVMFQIREMMCNDERGFAFAQTIHGIVN